LQTCFHCGLDAFLGLSNGIEGKRLVDADVTMECKLRACSQTLTKKGCENFGMGEGQIHKKGFVKLVCTNQ
jgi:hypothetical protein